MNNDPLDVDFDVIDNEPRYRSVGLTDGGRLLSVGGRFGTASFGP